MNTCKKYYNLIQICAIIKNILVLKKLKFMSTGGF